MTVPDRPNLLIIVAIAPLSSKSTLPSSPPSPGLFQIDIIISSSSPLRPCPQSLPCHHRRHRQDCSRSTPSSHHRRHCAPVLKVYLAIIAAIAGTVPDRPDRLVIIATIAPFSKSILPVVKVGPDELAVGHANLQIR
jgi:hypothetical protein